MDICTIFSRMPDGLTTLPPSPRFAIIAVAGSSALPCIYVGRNKRSADPASSLATSPPDDHGISKIRLYRP
jgi:hypothetical protein